MLDILKRKSEVNRGIIDEGKEVDKKDLGSKEEVR